MTTSATTVPSAPGTQRTGGREALGWDRGWQAAFERAAVEHAAEQLAVADARPGRVVATHRVGFDIHSPRGREFVTHKAPRRDPLAAPATGDWVVVADSDQGEEPLIIQVLDRRTAVIRRDPADAAQPQVLAANADTVAVVHGADRPVNSRRIERQLAVAHGSGAGVVIVMTKADLSRASATHAALSQALPHETVLATAARTGEGIDTVAALTQDDRTLVLLGESGAGKSSLINAVMGHEALDTAVVREGDAKGRHTTTRRELVALPAGGAILDTPGVRAIGLWPGATDLGAVFPRIAEAAVECRFRDCSHHAEPGCVVTAAVTDGRIAAEHLTAWHTLTAELAATNTQLERQGWR